jgi:hypothetical protein
VKIPAADDGRAAPSPGLCRRRCGVAAGGGYCGLGRATTESQRRPYRRCLSAVLPNFGASLGEVVQAFVVLRKIGCAVEIVIFFTLSKCGRGWLRNFAGGTGGFTVSVAGCLSSGGSGGCRRVVGCRHGVYGAGAVRELAEKMLG